MTDEDFAKSIGATPVNSSQSDEDFAKSIGAIKVDTPATVTKAKTPGVPDRPNVDLDHPVEATKTMDDKWLPWWMNYSHSDTDVFGKNGIPIVKDTADLHSFKDWDNYLGDLAMAGVRGVAHMGTGLIDTINNPINELVGGQKDANLFTNALDANTNAPTTRQQDMENSINQYISGLDPQMIMPYAHPTTPGVADFLQSRKIFSDRPTTEVPLGRQETAIPGDISKVPDRTPNPLANQSDLPGGLGVMDNIRRQLAGEIPESRDITNTPMERMTDTILNGRDQAGELGVKGVEGALQDHIARQLAEHDAMQRATEGITYENIPPDGSIPGNSPSRGITVPRDVAERWSPPDENGIPVRQDLPQVKEPTEVQNVRNDTPEANDLGNAIQEANGPKLGPDETWGSQPLDTPSPKFNVTMERARRGGPGGRQRGSIQLGISDEFINSLRDFASKKAEQIAKIKESGLYKNLSFTKQMDMILPYVREHSEALKKLNDAQEAKISAGREKELQQFKDFTSQVGEISAADKRSQFRVYKNSERGQNFMQEDLVNATADLVKKATSIISGLMEKGQQKFSSMLPEDHMANISGTDQVYRPDSGEKILAAGKAQGKLDTSLWKNVQSGMKLAAEKTGSAILHGAADWLHWTDKRTVLDNRKTVDPVHKQIKSLNDKDYQTLHKIMIREQGTRTLASAADLSSLSPKARQAYQAIRKAFDAAYQRSTQTRAALGLPAMTKEEAYHASMHYGDWRQSFYDKKGQLVWHVASGSKLEAMQAAAWLKKNVANIDWVKSEKAMFKPEATEARVPKDVMSAYQDMMRFFNPDHPVTKAISDSIAKYNQEKGISNKGFDQRFLDKSNIPGFEGNKPWLSDAKNANAFFDAQMKYLRDSNHWNNLQEAMAQLKPILKDEDLIRNQPNIMETVAAHLNRELGINSNKLAAIEAAWAKYFPKVGMVDGKPTVALGTSRGNVYKGVADVKAGTYLTMLGMNVPYMITTPLQAVMSIAQHRYLSEKGYSHNATKTMINSVGDIAAGLGRHAISSMAGKPVDLPMSEVGKRMLRYAEDNGILDKTVMDETGSTRTHAILDPIKNTLGKTITAPEKVARWSTFVGFAHHLIDSGLPEVKAFQMAEDFTNHSLTSMRRSDKPLIVDKLGTAGQLGYVFKSYLFNEYNQLAQLSAMARDNPKKAAPLALHMATLFTLGGALALPGINELDGAYNVFKDIMSKYAPSFFQDDIGLRGKILRDMPTWASIGTVSQVTGTNLGSRFNTQMTNIENPLGDVAVPIQEAKELASVGKLALDPTKQNAINVVHANAGATIKGAMETHLDSYKNLNSSTPNGRNPDNTQTYIHANDINNPSADYKRDPEEEFKRSLGFYSDKEYKTKQIRYINDKEQGRMMEAYTNLMEKAMAASKNGQTDRAQNLSKAALKLIPDGELYQKHINSIAQSEGMTPEERDIAHANRLDDVLKVLRARGQNANQ